MKQAIVIGAGITGATAARVLAESGFSVTLYEKKTYVAGAAYDFRDEFDALLHAHGPHIFHTNSGEAMAFAERFGEWIPYPHSVLGYVGGKLIPIPFNFRSIELCFDKKTATPYKEALTSFAGDGGHTTIGALLGANDARLKALADFVYENVFLHYTIKQWGMSPEKLGVGVMSRVPVRASYAEGYFTDTWQCMPRDGYTAWVMRMLAHERISLRLGEDAHIRLDDSGTITVGGVPIACPFVYTGSIDALMDYRYGSLPYRTLRFELKRTEWPFQPIAVVNYPGPGHEFTRITECGHFYPGDYPGSSVLYEYPLDYEVGHKLDPYYPIPTETNHALYSTYLRDAQKAPNLILAGRLGNYRYINMDAAILEGIRAGNDAVGY